MTQLKRIVVVGAGGFAREVKWLISEINARAPQYEFLGYVVSDRSRLGEHDSKDEVIGDVEWLRTHHDAFDCVSIGIGNPAVRLKIASELEQLGPDAWPSLVHPTVVFDRGSCRFGAGTILCAGVIATVNVVVEPYAMVNLACTLGHEAIVGSGSVLNPTVNVSGGVRIGRGALIGTGAQILQYVELGESAVVGAGAVVTKNVPPNTTVVGVPAKAMAAAK